MSTNTAADTLIARWIEPNLHKPGSAEALVLPRHISVWAVIELWQLDAENVRHVGEEFGLPQEAVEAAICYYSRHRAEVDARITRNAAAFVP